MSAWTQKLMSLQVHLLLLWDAVILHTDWRQCGENLHGSATSTELYHTVLLTRFPIEELGDANGNRRSWIGKQKLAAVFGGVQYIRRGFTETRAGLIFNALLLNVKFIGQCSRLPNCVQMPDTFVQRQRISIYKHVCSLWTINTHSCPGSVTHFLHNPKSIASSSSSPKYHHTPDNVQNITKFPRLDYHKDKVIKTVYWLCNSYKCKFIGFGQREKYNNSYHSSH